MLDFVRTSFVLAFPLKMLKNLSFSLSDILFVACAAVLPYIKLELLHVKFLLHVNVFSCYGVTFIILYLQ